MRMTSGVFTLTLLICNVVTPSPVKADGFFQVLYDTTRPVSPAYRTDMGYAVFVDYDGKRLLLDIARVPPQLGRAEAA